MKQRPISLYSVDDVRSMDSIAINNYGIDSYLLMTRAAQASLTVLTDCFPSARKILIICGAGNNAGDGYVLARLATDRGLGVTVRAISDPEQLSGDAKQAWQDFDSCGGRIESAPFADLGGYDVIVDALLGTGLTRPVSGDYAQVVQAINRSGVPVMSLDIPSGLDGDTGQPSPIAVAASVTITFVGLKTGLFTGQGPACCGQWHFSDLQIPQQVYSEFVPRATRIDAEEVSRLLPRRNADAHKGQNGRVLIVGGGKGMPGAVILAGSAALRAGAGLVKIACHEEHTSEIINARPELMYEPLATASDLDDLLAWCDVVAVGPGLGRDQWAEDIAAHALRTEKPLIVDADALFYLAAHVQKKPHWILSPHVGEAARLLHTKTSVIQNDRIGSCQKIAAEYGGTIILKGAGTVVTTEDSEIFLCDKGNPGMATAGTGDVLTGILAGIHAQSLSEEISTDMIARAAVWVHAAAGDRAAQYGERGLIASDLIEHIRAFVN